MRTTRRDRIGKLLVALFIMLLWPFGVWADVHIDRPFVTLSWEANPEPDVKGYEVYRSNSHDGAYVKAHEGLIAGASWTDSDVSNGLTYYYRIRAVDLCGNVSELSPPSDAVVIHLPEHGALVAPSPNADVNGAL